MDFMRLNKIRRLVNVIRPSKKFPGYYNTDANYDGDVDLLDRSGLFKILEKEGLDYSGVDYEILHGFNDRLILGVDEAKIEKENERSQIWIGLNHGLVNLEITPKIVNNLESENHFEYAERILGKVVTFVENSDNYLEKK